jgi:hypothetical protein
MNAPTVRARRCPYVLCRAVNPARLWRREPRRDGLPGDAYRCPACGRQSLAFQRPLVDVILDPVPACRPKVGAD